MEAAAHYSKVVPCLTFTDVGHSAGTSASAAEELQCQQSPAVFVTSDPYLGCFSHAGMVGLEAQQLNLNDPGCLLIGGVLHQLGHALGLVHEHPRFSNFLDSSLIADGRKHDFMYEDDPVVNEARIFANAAAAGNKAAAKKVDDFINGVSVPYRPYDPLSVMHLDPHMFQNVR